MVPISTRQWGWLEARSATLFLVGGGLVVIYAAVNGTVALGDPMLNQNPFKFGYVLGFLGLLGLYPTLAERRPWLARTGAVAAVLGMVGLSVFVVKSLAALAGIVPVADPVWYRFLVPLPLTGFVVGYLGFGLASLGADVYPSTLGFLLLIPGLIVVVMLVHISLGYASDVTAFVISAGEAMAHLAIGATLRTRSSATDRDESPTDGDREPMVHD